MHSIRGLLFIKHGAVGTRSEGPLYFLQTEHKDVKLRFEKRHPWELDYVLEHHNRHIVEVSGENVDGETFQVGELTGRVEVTSRYLPALDLGGDCFYYRWLDDDHLKLYLIDASGHGIRPAFLSMSVHNLIRSGSLPDAVLREPDLVLDEINRLFPMEDQADSYFTIWYGIYQASTRTLRYSSAGHPPALVLLRDGAGVTVSGLSTPASPIGMFADTVYTSDSYTVPHGAQLLLYSDGAFELPVHKADGKSWYRDDFVSLCMALTADPDWTLDDLVERLRSLIPDGDFDDDCALVLVTFP